MQKYVWSRSEGCIYAKSAKIIGGGLSSVGGTLKTAEFKGIVELSFDG